MITATYTVAASPWTQAIDAALSEWSAHLIGSVSLRIDLAFDGSVGLLASAGPRWWHAAGELDGNSIKMPSATADILTGQNQNSSATDIKIIINPNWPWFFGRVGDTPAHQYSAVSTMIHELGHGLFMCTLSGPMTPFQLWTRENEALIDADHGAHLIDATASMFYRGKLGPGSPLGPLDILAASQSGLPTHGDDLIFLPRNVSDSIDAGAGHDTAVWLGAFDELNIDLVNFEVLSMRGADPLTSQQQDLYRLYQAAFGRAPDLEGFRYWAGSGESVDDLAIHFAGSDEFSALYPDDTNALVASLYQNILGREPDEEGFEYWTGTGAPPATLLLGFALAPENGLGQIHFLV